MKREIKSALIILTMSLMVMTIAVQGTKIKKLQHEVVIQKERVLDIQSTCRMYEDEITELYGRLSDGKDNN